MGRLRGLGQVLIVLLGGAAVALAAGFVVYLVRSRNAPVPDADEGYEGWLQPPDPRTLEDPDTAELAEVEAASEAAVEFRAAEAPVLVGPEPEPEPIVAAADVTTVEVPPPVADRAAIADPPDPGPPAAPDQLPPLAPASRVAPVPQRLQWVLILGAILVGAAVGLAIYLATGGTIGA